MTDENLTPDEDPIEGDGPEPGKREGAGLPDEGIEGKGDDLGDSDTSEGEAGPASGTTESEGGPGLM
jgi:hypothetical protein